MKAKLLRSVVGLAILTVAAGADPPQPKKRGDSPAVRARIEKLEKLAKKLNLEYEKLGQNLTQQYEQGKKQFFAVQEKANEAMVNRFELTLNQVRVSTQLPAELRRAKMKIITAEKNAFKDKGRLPLSNEMLLSLLEYQETLHKARLPVAATHELLFNLYTLILNDDGRAEKLTKDKEAFDRKSRGLTVLRRSQWNGNQMGANNIPFVLNVDGLLGNAIGGSIVHNRFPNDTVFQVEGLLNGNRIEVRSTRVVQGKTGGLIFTGYVMENRILGQVVAVATNGKSSKPYLVLLYRR